MESVALSIGLGDGALEQPVRLVYISEEHFNPLDFVQRGKVFVSALRIGLLFQL